MNDNEPFMSMNICLATFSKTPDTMLKQTITRPCNNCVAPCSPADAKMYHNPRECPIFQSKDIK